MVNNFCISFPIITIRKSTRIDKFMQKRCLLWLKLFWKEEGLVMTRKSRDGAGHLMAHARKCEYIHICAFAIYPLPSNEIINLSPMEIKLW